MRLGRCVADQAARHLALYFAVAAYALHAWSGDCLALAAYLGRSSRFDHAIAEFAERYADQNDLDFAAFRAAAHDGAVKYTADV